MPIPDRRVLVVLATLLGAMTFASGLLLLLEPVPRTTFPTVQLRSLGNPDRDRQALFVTDTPLVPERYAGIIIHDSRTSSGSATTIANSQDYHFVIGNGHGADDGQIESATSWQQQLDGQFVTYVGDDPIDRAAIGVCLIGDTASQPLTEAQAEQLSWLVRELQIKFHIPAEQIVTPTGRMFPHSRFARQLLTPSLR